MLSSNSPLNRMDVGEKKANPMGYGGPSSSPFHAGGDFVFERLQPQLHYARIREIW
jgi:hypothetical protein